MDTIDRRSKSMSKNNAIKENVTKKKWSDECQRKGRVKYRETIKSKFRGKKISKIVIFRKDQKRSENRRLENERKLEQN